MRDDVYLAYDASSSSRLIHLLMTVQSLSEALVCDSILLLLLLLLLLQGFMYIVCG
jgi:hypothetical protein